MAGGEFSQANETALQRPLSQRLHSRPRKTPGVHINLNPAATPLLVARARF